MSNAAPVQVGLAGFGLAGRVFHAQLVQAAGMNIRGVITRKTEELAKALPGASAVPDIEALLALPELAVVAIATPNDLHEAQATAALQAGRCVVVDKPMVPDLAAADRLLQAASRSRGTLTVFHNRRWDSDFLTVQRLIASQALGPLHTFESRWNRYRPEVVERWREHAASGGGLLLDLGPHLIDQMLVLFGTPEWLQADLQCRRTGSEVDDSFEIRCGSAERRIVLSADCVTVDPGPRFRLHGTRGSYTKSGIDVQETQLRAGLSPLATNFGVEPADQDGLMVTAQHGQNHILPSERGRWLDFYVAVRAHIERGTPLPVDPLQVREGLRLIEAVRRSAATGARIAL
jgi:scyllo-inositol 2-dehydrogenase (NADP+)